MKKKIAFIINPISGGIDKETFPALVEKNIDLDKFEVEYFFTESSQHNLDLARQAVEQKKDVIAAVGGDGTNNNVAKYVTGSSSLLAMIPMGSGNGLARHLHIPVDAEKAIRLINNLNFVSIDTGTVNDIFFINVAGVGFDAHVSRMFDHAAKRGFWSYAKITLNEYSKYKPRVYELIIDGKKVIEKAFIVCIANGSQYGNNAFISPYAKPTDGIFEVSIIRPFHPVHLPLIGFDMFAKKFDRSKYVKTLRGKHIIIKRREAEVVNIDGEPVMMEKDIDIRIFPSSLKVIVPQ